MIQLDSQATKYPRYPVAPGFPAARNTYQAYREKPLATPKTRPPQKAPLATSTEVWYDCSMANNRKHKTKANAAAWREMRKSHLAVYPECRVCGVIKKKNHVHHTIYRGDNYAQGTYEKSGDLVTFCVQHYNKFHQIYGMTSFNRDFINETLEYIEREKAVLSNSQSSKVKIDSDTNPLQERIYESIRKGLSTVAPPVDSPTDNL